MTIQTPKMLTIKEASISTGLSEHFIRRTVLSGAILAIRTGTSRSKILVNAESLFKMLQTSTLSTPHEEEIISGIRRIAE